MSNPRSCPVPFRPVPSRKIVIPSYTSAPPRYGGWVCLRDTNKAIGFFLVLHSLRHICLRVFYALPSACKVIFILKKFQDSFSSFFQLLLCVSQAIPVLSQFLHSSPVLGSRMCKYFLLMKVMAVTVHSFVVWHHLKHVTHVDIQAV